MKPEIKRRPARESQREWANDQFGGMRLVLAPLARVRNALAQFTQLNCRGVASRRLALVGQRWKPRAGGKGARLQPNSSFIEVNNCKVLVGAFASEKELDLFHNRIRITPSRWPRQQINPASPPRHMIEWVASVAQTRRQPPKRFGANARLWLAAQLPRCSFLAAKIDR